MVDVPTPEEMDQLIKPNVEAKVKALDEEIMYYAWRSIDELIDKGRVRLNDDTLEAIECK